MHGTTKCMGRTECSETLVSLELAEPVPLTELSLVLGVEELVQGLLPFRGFNSAKAFSIPLEVSYSPQRRLLVPAYPLELQAPDKLR